MKNRYVVVAVVALLFSAAPAPASAQEISLSGLIDLFISLGIIPQEKADDARSALGGQISTSPSFSCVNISHNLYLGVSDRTTNGEVSELQQFLRSTGDFTYPQITGYFGPATEQAVQRWQARNGVISSGSPDTTGYGVVGPQTREVMSCDGDVLPEPRPGDRFSVSPTSGTAPLQVTFSANYGGFTLDRFELDPGDGSARKAVFCYAPADACIDPDIITHTYSEPGTYKAHIVRVSHSGAEEILESEAVTVQGSGSSTGSFSVSPTSGSAPLTTTATIKVPLPLPAVGVCGPIIVGTIDWGDGSESRPTRLGCSSQSVVTVSHTYQHAGTYTVTFVGSGITKEQSIKVTGGTQADSLSASPTSGTKPLAVTFKATPPNTTFFGGLYLFFGDGNSVWCGMRGNWLCNSKTHTYHSAGTYTAKLVGVGEGGGDQTLDTLTINVEEGSQTDEASISVTSPTHGSLAIHGQQMPITWSSSDAPDDAKVRLEIWPVGTTPSDSHNEAGIASQTYALPVTGTYNWTVPLADGPEIIDAGFRSVLPSGDYFIFARLYSGNECWGFCAPSSEDRTIHATAKSAPFKVTSSKLSKEEVHGSTIIGVYQGTYPDGVQSSYGYHPEGTVKVNVTGERSGNRRLVLTAYEPVHWIINNPNKIQIDEVVLIGYYDQRVSGLSSGTAVESHSYKLDGVYRFAYTDSGYNYQRLIDWVEAKYGTVWNFISGGYTGSTINAYIGQKG